MTKLEALKALQDGKKVRHYYFASNEWISQLDHKRYEFEDGYCYNIDEFWNDRQAPGFENNWEIVNF